MRSLAATLVLIGAGAARAQQSLAVLDFRDKLGGKEVDAGYFADVVRSAALRALPGLRVITKENLIVLLQNTGEKLEDCEGECEVETGRRIGADLIVSGDLLRIGSALKLDLKLHETRGGRLLAGTVASGGTVDELDANTGAAVRELLSPLRDGWQFRVQTAPEVRIGAVKAPPAALEPAPAGPPPLRKAGLGLIGGSLLLGAGAAVATQASPSTPAMWPLAIAAGAALVAGVAMVVASPDRADPER